MKVHSVIRAELDDAQLIAEPLLPQLSSKVQFLSKPLATTPSLFTQRIPPPNPAALSVKVQFSIVSPFAPPTQ